MAWTASDVSLLEQAILDGRGAREITFSDQRIVFHSLSEMRDLLAEMRRDVSGGSPTRYAATSKGA